jgi:UDP-N-acetylmuramate dehydrogenase
MQVYTNYDLKPYNTFQVTAVARQFASFTTIGDLGDICHSAAFNKGDTLLLGGGSNVLFTRDFDGLVLKNEITGCTTINEDDKYVYIKAGAGVDWHQFVLHCIDKNLAGVENLSLIPGSVGASPLQNIGAYGVEIKDVFYSLEAYHMLDNKLVNFTLNECEFGYRDSVFKRKLKNQFAICFVTFRLSKVPRFNISYGAIQQELEKMQVEKLTIKDISDAVIRIRSSKLPDPKFVGNAGSFYKNPEINADRLQKLREQDSTIPAYHLDQDTYKIPAGWLIEQCGWKGYRKGDAGCYDKQALVLVNFGSASGREILELSESIKASVLDRFGIDLETEVNII